MTTLDVFWHSFGLGVGSSSPTVFGVVPLVAAAKNYSVNNQSISGAEIGDLADAVFAMTPSSSSKTLLGGGLNNQRHFGLASNSLNSFELTALALALKLSVLDADLVKPGSAGVTYSGFGGSPVAFGARWTDTHGDYAEFTATGDHIYVLTVQQDGCPGQYEIFIDGSSKGTFNVAPPSAIATALGRTYMPVCHRFDVGGDITDTHTVRLQKANASAFANRVYFLGGWANGMKSGAYPEVYLIGDPPCTPAGYAGTGIGSWDASRAYADKMLAVQEVLASDALGVFYADIFTNSFAALQTDSGGCHRNDGGQWQMADILVRVIV